MAKSVLITGASSGIGQATSALMARRGWRVAATARDLSTLDPNAGHACFRVDVTDERSIADAVARTVERFGRIDVLVNNAGYGMFGPLEGATVRQIELQFRTNLLGAIAMIQHVLPVMRRQRSGAIVNVSSIGGRVAAPFASLYHASKFAIEGLSESLRYEASLHGIRVKLVEPAHFRTGFISRSIHFSHHHAYDAAFDNYMGWVYEEDRKAPPPDAVAEAILRAADSDSARLRYPVKGGLIFALARVLPDVVFRSLMAGGMTRPSPGKSHTPAAPP